MVVKTRNFPGVTFNETSSNQVAQSVSTPVELLQSSFMCVYASFFCFSVESDVTGVMWRLAHQDLM